MANFFKAKKTVTQTNEKLHLTIERLDLNGSGVSHYKNKPIFVDGALVGEKVTVKVTEEKGKFRRAKLLEINSPSAHRAEPNCKHFSQCGGCDLQHLAESEHIALKQDKVATLFSRQHITVADKWQPAIKTDAWGYRRKARIGVQYNKKGQATIGFRRKSTNDILSISSCPILEAKLCDIFSTLNDICHLLAGHKPIGHIEVIATDDVTLVIRQLSNLSKADREVWLNAANKNKWQIYIDDGNDVVALNDVKPMRYNLPNDITINFQSNDFIQVNKKINEEMIKQAMTWLMLSIDDVVLDLFSGLGNFSLPVAKQVNKVVGVEGVQSMVDKATENAKQNRIENCQFKQADLNNTWPDELLGKLKPNKVILDPARAGAFKALEQLVKLNPTIILYVSCEPSSLAIDSKLLLENGYRLEKISIIEMFSQTKHVETMVLYTKE